MKTIIPDKRIKTLDQLYKCDFIIFRGKPYNKGWFRSWQLRTAMLYIEYGIYEGVKVTKVKKGDK